MRLGSIVYLSYLENSLWYIDFPTNVLSQKSIHQWISDKGTLKRIYNLPKYFSPLLFLLFPNLIFILVHPDSPLFFLPQ